MRYGVTQRANALLALALVATTATAPACSLLIDSDTYVLREDAGARDAGPDSGEPTDGGPEDGGPDQGTLVCGSGVCPADQFCHEGECLDCLTNAHCANNLCDPVTGTCLDPVTSCDACGGSDACVDHPNGGGKVCLECDRDADGFPSSWSLCSGEAPGRPRDCDDANGQRFPGAAPICGDTVMQGCPAPAYDDVLGFLGGTIEEFGRLPNLQVEVGVDPMVQLSTVAREGAYLARPGDDEDAARWVFGFVYNGEAEVRSIQIRGFRPDTGTYDWDTVGGPLRNLANWPIDTGKTRAFAMDAFAGTFRYAAAGDIASVATVNLMQHSGSGIETLSTVTEPAGFLAPLAIIGGTTPQLISRIDRQVPVVDGRRLWSQTNDTTTGAFTVIPGPGTFLLDAEGDHVFYTPSGRATGEAWDGVAAQGVNTGGSAGITSLMTGPSRFSRDPATGTITGLLPYADGLRVVRFVCTGPGLANCTSTATAIQPHLQNLTVFDMEVLNDVIYVIHVQGKQLMLDIFTHSALTLVRRTPVSIPLIREQDVPLPVTRVSSVDTHIQMGSLHAEIVVGALIDTGTSGTLMATGLRACAER